MEIIFEWDAQKANTNIEEHKISFNEARTVFHDPLLVSYFDEFHSSSEERFISIGMSEQDHILLVVHTEHYENDEQIIIRIISCRKEPELNEKPMKNKSRIPKDQDNDMLPEYDFKGKKGMRGKYYRAMQRGYTVRITNEDGTVTIQQFEPKEGTVMLDPDVRAYFPDSESVNRALRSLIELIPEKRQTAEDQAKYKK